MHIYHFISLGPLYIMHPQQKILATPMDRSFSDSRALLGRKTILHMCSVKIESGLGYKSSKSKSNSSLKSKSFLFKSDSMSKSSKN